MNILGCNILYHFILVQTIGWYRVPRQGMWWFAGCVYQRLLLQVLDRKEYWGTLYEILWLSLNTNQKNKENLNIIQTFYSKLM